jgi:hypothetical protein
MVIQHKRTKKYRKQIIITFGILAGMAFGALITFTELGMLCKDYLNNVAMLSGEACIIFLLVLPFAICIFKRRIDRVYMKLINSLKDSD